MVENNTAAVVEEIKTTDWSGIDGILSICPYYNKPSQEGLYQQSHAYVHNPIRGYKRNHHPQ